ncbi:MAG: hypothetical protein ACNA8W_20585 [Bradymonadaceae bacterium]
MNLNKISQILILGLGAVCLFAVSAQAAIAPFEMVRHRLIEVREQTKDVRVEATLTLTGEELKEFRGGSLDYKAGESWTLGEVGGDGKLKIAGDGSSFDRLIWLMVLADDPIGKLGEWGVGVAPSETSVEVHGDDLVYRYGESTRIWVSRDLSRLLRVQLVHGKHRWDASVTGTLEESWMPAMVTVTKDGRPFGVLRLVGVGASIR